MKKNGDKKENCTQSRHAIIFCVSFYLTVDMLVLNYRIPVVNKDYEELRGGSQTRIYINIYIYIYIKKALDKPECFELSTPCRL